MGHDKVKAKRVSQGQSSSVKSPNKGHRATRLSVCKADLASIPSNRFALCPG
ncbi:hypothetical protein I79_018937 [Cricetulus griseus]|uniref:Uncharacterized protein n=1 Tax=Cricetulus griseus TaxID=10029 RepID=G3I626_CRIGR|nr:hypothetical protein I79_018937 [Cricetulus griseus]